MFGLDKTIAVQDPSYPVYVDTTVMMGNTGGHDGKAFEGITYMVCDPANNFFPDLSKARGRAVTQAVARRAWWPRVVARRKQRGGRPRKGRPAAAGAWGRAA